MKALYSLLVLLVATNLFPVDTQIENPSSSSTNSIVQTPQESLVAPPEESPDFAAIDFDDDDTEEDLVATSEDVAKRSTATKKIRKTNKSSKPNKPDYSMLHYSNKGELDSEKYKQYKDSGLKTIEQNESKGTKASVNAICKELLSNPVPVVRIEAANALSRMKRGLKALHIAINSDGFEVKQAAYNAIEKIGSKTSFNYFIKGISSGDSKIEIASYTGLGKSKTKVARDLILKKGLKSTDPYVVASALDSLGYFGNASDLKIFKEFLKSNILEYRAGAIRGLGKHNSHESLAILVESIETNKDLEPEVIYAIAGKPGLSATLSLIKIMQETKNENYKAVIEKELTYRKAFGKYAIITYRYATLRKDPVVGSKKITRLNYGEVARIRKETYKRFRAKMNGKDIEDSYYLLQAMSKEKNSMGKVIEGWVFGPKINIITIRDNGVTPANKDKKLDPNKKPFDITEDEEFSNDKTVVDIDDSEGKEEPSKKDKGKEDPNDKGKEEPSKKVNKDGKEESIEKDQDEDVEDEDD